MTSTRHKDMESETGQLWRQYIIAGVANIATAATGYCMGWTSPVNIKLEDENLTDSPLPTVITTAEESWVGSILSLGAILGSFIGGPLAARIGRKWTLLASSAPMLIGWILIAAATSVAFLYVGRFLWGISAGMLFTISPTYCAEIATTDSRGALGSYLQVFITTGYLVMYCIGPFVSYYVIAYVGIIIVIVFDVLFFFMPESPRYHLMKNDRDSAAKCLMTIRGQSRIGIETELDIMVRDVAISMAKTASLRDVFRGGNFKAFYISCALVFFQQFCGINAVLFNLANIFEVAGSDLNSSYASIIVGIVHVGASWVTPFVVDRLGRRLLLLFSSCGTAVASVFLGMFFFLDHEHSLLVDSIRFLPILCLVVFMLTYSVGLGPLAWAVMSELFSIEVKAIAAPIATAFCWVMSFLITRYFAPISKSLGMYTAFWFFCVCCVGSFFFTLFLVPETKGKSFAEIQEILAGKSSKRKAKLATPLDFSQPLGSIRLH